MIDEAIQVFWNIATQCVQLIVPIIGIRLLFNTISELLFKEKF